jgi:GNAT superfamily N-acetyltransferase
MTTEANFPPRQLCLKPSLYGRFSLDHLWPLLRDHRGDVPGFRLARIATDLRCQGQSIGGQLFAAAARRCLRAAAEVGGVVLIIDAKNDRAARWYASYGAVLLSDKPLTLVMSLASFAADLKAAGQL